MKHILSLIRFNWKSGLTVSLVSLPLSIALAIASGATPTQGIITAFWAGLFGAFFGGSHFNIIGPTGALSGILITYTITHGFANLPIIAILAGILMLIACAFNLDKYIIFIPRSVVHGFTLGVAFIIGLGQLDNALGLVSWEKTDNILHNLVLIAQHAREFNPIAIVLFICSVIFIFAWNKKIPKFPGAIIIAVLGIILSVLISYGILPDMHLQTLAQKYPDMSAQLFFNAWEHFSWSVLYDREVWVIAMATALIGILETLLSGQIAEHKTKVHFDRRAEVFGLSIANIASGLMGGIPATAALARTSLNINSGATHKTSALLNSFFLLSITIVFLSFFKWLPMVVVASILVFVSISMVEAKHFIYFFENEKTAFALSIIVALITIGEDPIMGILIGTVIALLIFVHNMSKGQTEILIWNKGTMTHGFLKDAFVKHCTISSDMVVYKISGSLTYVNMPAHLKAVECIKGNKLVIISLRYALYIDIDGVEYLDALIQILKKQNEHVVLSGVNPIITEKIKQEDFYQQKLSEGKIYTRTSDAIDELYLKKIKTATHSKKHHTEFVPRVV